MSDYQEKLHEAVATAESALGFEIPESVLIEVLTYTKRKLDLIKKNSAGYADDYLPVLYENEIRDYYTRKSINMAHRRA